MKLALAVILLYVATLAIFVVLHRRLRVRLKALEDELRRADASSVDVLRHFRHDVLNHVQVISGWLQLGRPERAMDYIAEARRRVEEEGEVLKLGVPSLARKLLAERMRLHAAGTTFMISGTPELDQDLGGLDDMLLQLVRASAEVVRRAAPAGERSLRLLVDRDGDRVLFSLLSEPEVTRGALLEQLGRDPAAEAGRTWREWTAWLAGSGGVLIWSPSEPRPSLVQISWPLLRSAS